MAEDTKERLVAAASDLLDAGGQAAVTLRAVAEIVGVSHNAPYRHFRDRSALLAAVAERDFDRLRQAFQAHANDPPDARTSLKAALMEMIAYARAHPARYRLLFSDPDLISVDRVLEVAAFGAFQAFAAIVQRCQEGKELQSIGTARMTGLIYATLHGTIDLELGGRAREAKGLGSIETTMDLLLDLLAHPGRSIKVR
jgi:AcrR family transcriptional regulator